MKGSPFKHVFCCVVHENVNCVLDLVRNLRFFAPDSAIVLYDGSTESILKHAVVLEWLGAVRHPAPRPMLWGRLHESVFDCLEYVLSSDSFDAVTFIDSDQLLTRRGYVAAVQAALEDRPRAGVLGTPNPSIGEEWGTELEPGEQELWKPFLDRFPSGQEHRFPRRWIFWPGTVITRAAAGAICDFRSDPMLADILERTTAASEEIAFSTLAALLGYEVIEKPWNDEWVRWRLKLRVPEVAEALADPTCFWLHPVLRRSDDPARIYLRHSNNEYRGYTPAPIKDPTAEASQSATASRATRRERRTSRRFIRLLAKHVDRLPRALGAALARRGA